MKMSGRMVAGLMLGGSLLLGGARPAGAETVYLKPKEALAIIFHDAEKITVDKKVPTAEQAAAIRKATDAAPKKEYVFYVARSGERVDGYALIDHEIGKTEPITFLTALTPEGQVKEVEVLVYRESHGAEVREARFRRQFRGKGTEDPLRIGGDLQNVSGATLSSRALATGVKRALLLWRTFYKASP